MGAFLRESDNGEVPAVAPAIRPYNVVRPLTAAAARVKVQDKYEMELLRKRKNAAQWQNEAWTYFDNIGEIKYAFLLTGSVISRLKLFVGYVENMSDNPSRIESMEDLPANYSDVALSHFQRLETGYGGLPGLLREAAINLCVPGECYLVQEKAKAASGIPEKWTIRSTDEVEVDNNGNPMLRGSRSSSGKDGLEPISQDAFIGRIWRPHPRAHDDADSSMRALLDLSAELLLLNRTFRATAKSRLNAGALFIPDGLSVAAQPDVTDEDGDFETAEDDAFEQELIAAMTMPIQDDDSASAVVPLLIRGPGELGSQIKQFKFERSFDDALVARADRVLERILQGLDIPKDVVTGLANVRYALSTDTDIMTRDGWKTYEQVAVGDDVYTLNHATGLGEWQPLQEINVHEVDEPLLRMESNTHSSLSTAEHKWATVKTGKKVCPGTERRWTTSGDGFTSTDRVETAAPCANLPTEPKYTDDFVRLVALFTSDGYYDNSCRMRVAKTDGNRNPDAVRTIRTILAAVDPGYGEYAYQSRTPNGAPVAGRSFRLTDAATEAVAVVCVGQEKVVTFDFVNSLTLAQLHLFLDAFIEIGDGVQVGDGLRRYWQQNRDRLEPIAMAAVLAGHTVRWLPTTQTAHGPVTGSRPVWGLTVTKKRTWFSPYAIARHGAASWEHYTGKVWCPTTANHTWLARRNGKVFFTGNSNAIQIQDSMYRSHIEPLALIICDALTMIFMRPAMEVMGFPKEVIENTVIWYDATDILTSSDRATNADSGWDKYLLSGPAWRAAHGFAETDSPTGDELLNRIIIQRGQISAELTEAVLAQIAPESFAASRETALAAEPTEFPESLDNMLETGQLPADQEPLPPEVLEGLPVPSPAPPGEEAPIEESAPTGEAPAEEPYPMPFA